MTTRYSLSMTSLLDGLANRHMEVARRWFPEDAELERNLKERLECLKRDYSAHGESDHPTELSLSSSEVLHTRNLRLKSIEEDYCQFESQSWAHSMTVLKVQGTIVTCALIEAIATFSEVGDLRRQGIRFPSYIAPALKMAGGRAVFFIPLFYLTTGVIANGQFPGHMPARSFTEDFTYDVVRYGNFRSPEQLRKDLLTYMVPWVSAAAFLALVQAPGVHRSELNAKGNVPWAIRGRGSYSVDASRNLRLLVPRWPSLLWPLHKGRLVTAAQFLAIGGGLCTLDYLASKSES